MERIVQHPAVITASGTRGERMPSRCLVVMYHYIHDAFAGSDLIARSGRGVRGLTPAQFEAQLDQLSGTLTPLDWAGLTAGLGGKKNLPDQSFLLTFDDGLAEHAQVVAPILGRRGLRGVFFVPGAALKRQKMLSAHAIHLLLERLGEKSLTDELGQALRPLGRSLDLTGEEEAQACKIYHYETPELARLKFFLTLKLPLATRASVVGRLFEKHVGPHRDWARRWYMGPDDLRHLQAAGHTVGGHSFAHEPYGRLIAPDLQRDISQCAWGLREILGPANRPFAFPFGSSHPRAGTLLCAAGFSVAFGTDCAWLTPGSPKQELPRVDAIRVGALLGDQA